MEPQDQLAQNLLSEAEAYGYTLSIWESGALLLTTYGTPALVEGFLYVGERSRPSTL